MLYPSKAIVLTGIKHCGKSTQGRILAERLGCAFFDTDDVVLETTGRSPREIYTVAGAAAFMQAEAEVCRLLSQKIALSGHGAIPAVVSTGGGICNNEQALNTLHEFSSFVFLEMPEKIAADRIVAEISYINGRMTDLPAYIARENPETEDDVRRIFSAFFRQRCALYRQFADVICKLDDVPKEENARKIWTALQDAELV